MNKKLKIINILLINILIIIILVYFFYLFQNTGQIKINSEKKIKSKIEKGNNEVTTFNNVKYTTFDEKGKKYVTTSIKAVLFKSRPDIVKLENVTTITNLGDGSKLMIKSEIADYFKITKEIHYSGNVTITNKNLKITSYYGKYQPSKNLVHLETNVVVTELNNKIKADLVIYDIIKNNIEFKMKNKTNKVYGEREKKD